MKLTRRKGGTQVHITQSTLKQHTTPLAFSRVPPRCWEGCRGRMQTSNPSTTFYLTRDHLEPSIAQWRHGELPPTDAVP